MQSRRAAALSITLCVVVALAGGCSNASKKLGGGGNVAETLFYELLGADRGTQYYYEMVRDSHDQERFCYRCTSDPFLVDKAINAVHKLGDGQYARLEGQAQVMALLVDVLLEDPSALAQAHAANSLTRLALKLPRYRRAGPEEGGAHFLALLQEMDGMHDDARKTLRRDLYPDPGAARARMVQILTQIGDFEMGDLGIAKDALKPFYTRDYLIDATDAGVRTAADTALVKRVYAMVEMALRAAVDGSVDYVREEAVRGLKTLGDEGGVSTVLARLEVERASRVRAEIVEYLGRVGGEEAVAALLPMLEDGDGTIRHKARRSLARIAGQDQGIRRRAWTRWARARYPGIEVDEEQEGGPATR